MSNSIIVWDLETVPDLRGYAAAMQIENDYDKEVYNGDLGFITPRRGRSRSISTAERSFTRAASLTAWCWLTRPPSISRKARNIRPSSCRSRPSITRCFSAIYSTPASPAASGSSCLSGKERRLQLPCAMFRGGRGGPNCGNGSRSRRAGTHRQEHLLSEYGNSHFLPTRLGRCLVGCKCLFCRGKCFTRAS